MPNPAGPAGTLALIPPTRARHWIVVFAVTLAVIQYIDRVCIAKAAPLISRDLALSKEQMGWVFSAFTLAYALFEVPTGYWGDRIGPRRILLRVVLWSSFFTAATGWVFNQLSLVVVRFLFGAGEAGCFPNLTKAFSYWLPPAERLRTQAVMWTSTRWGGAITPAVVFLVLGVVNWRVAFLGFGLVGVVLAVAFAPWAPGHPPEPPAVRPQAVMWTGSRGGGGLAPAVVFRVLGGVIWRGAFLLFGLGGVVWAVASAPWFRHNPREHPPVTPPAPPLPPEQAGKGHRPNH